MGGRFGELLLLFIVAMLLFGPQKLPDLARAMGEAIREFKKAANGETSTQSQPPAPAVQPAPPAQVQARPLPHRPRTNPRTHPAPSFPKYSFNKKSRSPSGNGFFCFIHSPSPWLRGFRNLLFLIFFKMIPQSAFFILVAIEMTITAKPNMQTTVAPMGQSFA